LKGTTYPPQQPWPLSFRLCIRVACGTRKSSYPQQTSQVSHTEKGGLCGIETGDFSNSRAELTKRYDDIVYAAETKALGISIDAYAKNDFDAPTERTFAIYQMKSGDETRDFRFEGLDRLEQQGIAPSLSMYDKVYEGVLPATATLSNIFEQFNIDRPADFTGHSLSVSDIIVIEYKGDITANYIDKYGFEALPDFAEQHQAFTEKQQPPIVGEISFASGEEDNPHNIDHYAESIKHDNDIDLDREKTREQLGFRDTPEKTSMAERFAAAKAEAARRGGEKDRQHPEQTKNEREGI
jgi:hypothetical protein